VTVAVDELDDLSGVPRYRQIAAVVAGEIRSGQWESGSRAPSRNDLASRFGVARETAARAHRYLADQGYIVAVAGVGMVVTPESHWPHQ
jgi:GntR family transcriptional regulator